MALKDKVWIIALAGGILILVGWATPYIWTSVGGADVMLWSWGLVYETGSGIWFIAQLAIAGIFIIISAILVLTTGYLSKKREDLRKIAIIWLITGILTLIGVFIPLIMRMSAIYLSIGFYLPLFGGIITFLTGIVARYVN